MDNVTLAIENLKLQTGSYIDAFLQFMDEQQIYDPEDVLEVINPILLRKIRQEFKDKNHFSSDSPHYKRNSLEDFLDK